MHLHDELEELERDVRVLVAGLDEPTDDESYRDLARVKAQLDRVDRARIVGPLLDRPTP